MRYSFRHTSSMGTTQDNPGFELAAHEFHGLVGSCCRIRVGARGHRSYNNFLAYPTRQGCKAGQMLLNKQVCARDVEQLIPIL